MIDLSQLTKEQLNELELQIQKHKEQQRITPMITEEQILELANEYLEEWEADEDGRTWKEYSGTCKDILDFARAIYEMGNENGWESREEAEYFNSSYPTGLVGDPQ